MPKGIKVPLHVQQEILLRFDAYRREQLSIMDACARISCDLGQRDEENRFDLPPKSVWAVLQRLRPSTDIAKLILKAGAAKLAKRIIKKASVSEALDVLSRPGIEVIARPQSGEEGGQTGFFLTVQADTCGAVTVGAAIGQRPVPKQIETVTFDPFSGALGGFEYDEDARTEKAVPDVQPLSAFSATEGKDALLQRARAKIEESRRRHQGIGRLQDADGEAQAAIIDV